MTDAIPTLPDGRPFIPGTWLVEHPHIAEPPLDGYVGAMVDIGAPA